MRTGLPGTGTSRHRESTLRGIDLCGLTERFDVIVSAGNVMTFLDPATRRDVPALAEQSA